MESIIFSSGFELEKGAELAVQAGNVAYDQQSLKSAGARKRKPIDYSQPLQYQGKVYDYSSTSTGTENPGPLEATPFAFSVFPNPASRALNIKINRAFDLSGNNVKFELIDVYGHTVIKDKIESVNENLDIRTLVSGIYFLKIVANAKSHTRKIMIK
jgi:hypothetical protein